MSDPRRAYKEKQRQKAIAQAQAKPVPKTEAQLRDEDFQAGMNRAQQLIGTGSLGTIDMTPEEMAQNADILARRRAEADRGPQFAEQNSADVMDILKRRKEGLAGLTAEENQALRSRFKQELGVAGQSAQRQLAIQQNRLGVRGATAGAQQQALISQNQIARANAERDLLIKNIEMKQNNLSAYEQSVRQAENDISLNKIRNIELRQSAINALEATSGSQAQRRLELAQLNQRARANERFGQISIAMGTQQMGANERTGQAANAASVAAAQAQGGGGKK